VTTLYHVLGKPVSPADGRRTSITTVDRETTDESVDGYLTTDLANGLENLHKSISVRTRETAQQETTDETFLGAVDLSPVAVRTIETRAQETVDNDYEGMITRLAAGLP